MKLVKLSLATIVAVGAMATISSAQPLEEAIKGVDVSGHLRYRYDNKKEKDGNSAATHKFRAGIAFKTPIQDNFRAVVYFEGQSTDKSGTGHRKLDESVSGPFTDNKKTSLVMKEFYGVWTIPGADTALHFGKQKVGSYFQGDSHEGTGLKILNTSLPGWTFAAIAFDGLGDSGDFIGDGPGNPYYDHMIKQNLYGAAVIGSIDAGAFQMPMQFWAGHLTKSATLFAVDLQPTFEVGDFEVGLIGQAGFSLADKKVKDETDINNGLLFLVAANADFKFLDASLGYVNYSAKKKDGHSHDTTFAIHDSGQYEAPGEQLIDYTNVSGENQVFFAGAGVDIADFRLGGEVLIGENKFDGEKTKANEYVARAAYKVNKNLRLKSYFSYLDNDKDSDENDIMKFRFEARYNF